MQTALLDSFAILPLVASTLIQIISFVFLVRIKKNTPDKFSDPLFFWLSVFPLVLLALSGFLSLVFPGLLLYVTGILVASIAIMVLIILYYSFIPPQKTESEIPEAVPTKTEKGTDPLITIAQSFLEHVSESLEGEQSLVRLLDFINTTLIDNTDADGGVIFLADDFDDILAAKSFSGQFPPPYKLPSDLPHKPVRVETNFRYSQFALNESIFGEVAASGKSVLIQNGAKDPRIVVNGPEEFLKPGSYIFIPIMVKDKVIGVSGLARLPEKEPFTKVTFQTALILASYSGSAINNVYGVQEILERADLEREASIASRIQKTLQPKRLPELPELGFGSFFTSTKGVCGDYYDIILARRDKIGLVIADVAGKGIQSSMVMIMLRSILHLVTNTTKSSATILDWINKGITGKIDMDHYATVAYVNYSPVDHSIEFASAGHQPLLLYRSATGEIEKHVQKTDPIGIERSSIFLDLKLTVQKGDIIILFTDGLIEALNRDGKQYGVDTLSRVVKEYKSLSAREIAQEVKQNMQAFVGSASLHDDQTLVVMKIKA